MGPIIILVFCSIRARNGYSTIGWKGLYISRYPKTTIEGWTQLTRVVQYPLCVRCKLWPTKMLLLIAICPKHTTQFFHRAFWGVWLRVAPALILALMAPQFRLTIVPRYLAGKLYAMVGHNTLRFSIRFFNIRIDHPIREIVTAVDFFYCVRLDKPGKIV